MSTDPDVIRRQRCVNVTALATVGNTVSHLVINGLHDFHALIPINIYNPLMIVVPPLFLRLHRYSENAAAITLGHFGHPVRSTFVCLHFLAPPATCKSIIRCFRASPASPRGPGLALVPSVVRAVGSAGLLFCSEYAPFKGLIIPEDEKFHDALSLQAMVNALAINAAIWCSMRTPLGIALQTSSVNNSTEGLIETMMPRPIAERLKSGEEHIADRIEMLSVMFADLVGFTRRRTISRPRRWSISSTALVRACDALCERYGVEKIKTIGDSYMAAAGFDGRAARARSRSGGSRWR